MTDTPLESMLCRVIWALAIVLIARTLIGLAIQFAH